MCDKMLFRNIPEPHANILFDHQIYSVQKHGGISAYFNNLILHFRQKGIMCNLPVLLTRNKSIPANATFIPDSGVSRLDIAISLAMERYNRLESVRLLKQQDFDVFHPTYYNPYFLDYIGSKPYIVTVFDMIHELYPEQFPSNDRTAEWKAETVKHASHIIAISNNTKKDIVRILGTKPDKISVVYPGGE